jgi:hypothetical protein
MIFKPQIEGQVTIRSTAPTFSGAFHRRVGAGLLTGRPHPRSNYRIGETRPGLLAVHAADWWTAINVGLNEIDLELRHEGLVHYRVRYWRWAAYAIALGATLGSIGIALLLGLDLRGYLSSHSRSMVPGLSVEQNVAIAWMMVLFWGFAWPWLLIALHKKPLRGLVERVITDVDGQASEGHRH